MGYLIQPNDKIREEYENGTLEYKTAIEFLCESAVLYRTGESFTQDREDFIESLATYMAHDDLQEFNIIATPEPLLNTCMRCEDNINTHDSGKIYKMQCCEVIICDECLFDFLAYSTECPNYSSYMSCEICDKTMDLMGVVLLLRAKNLSFSNDQY